MGCQIRTTSVERKFAPTAAECRYSAIAILYTDSSYSNSSMSMEVDYVAGVQKGIQDEIINNDKELKRKFTPEFINRIDQIVYFNSLTDDNLKNIVKLEINKFNNRLNNIEYNIEYTDDVVNYIHAEAIKKKELGARPIIRLIQTNIEDKITELMLTNDYKPKYVFHASCEGDEIVIK